MCDIKIKITEFACSLKLLGLLTATHPQLGQNPKKIWVLDDNPIKFNNPIQSNIIQLSDLIS